MLDLIDTRGRCMAERARLLPLWPAEARRFSAWEAEIHQRSFS